MSDKFYPPSLEQLLQLILKDLDTKSEILGIPEKLFYKPWQNHFLYTKSGGKTLHNPIGLAAGPHTQLAQNIVSGWLCGARFIELKTIQENDHLEVTKPCIDMQYEGYNCEWSQELEISDSFDQYLNAWILIHVLHHRLYSSLRKNVEVGTIFNMSIGYNLDQVRSRKVQWFIDKMKDCSAELAEKIRSVKHLYPAITTLRIPSEISNSVTLSTMHGCPSREIEYIVKYLMVDKKLHTTVKFNPTLLGARSVRAILNQERGFDVRIPDSSFENDLQYADAIALIQNLQKTAEEMKLALGFKLSNTLECFNKKKRLPEKEEKIYLSGNALHPIAVNLAANLQTKFEGNLQLSFSGGADCFNISKLITCGFSTITVCSDLLKPGGYARLVQYFEQLSKAFAQVQAKNVFEYILKTSTEYNASTAALDHLKGYAIHTLNNKAYQKNIFQSTDIKTERPLNPYDCIAAPCIGKCHTNQHIPDYLWHAGKDDIKNAFRYIIANNPFPSVTGAICDHLCQTKCTRINYDEPVMIREVKRYVAENINGDTLETSIAAKKIEKKVAIIGAGPSGLSCAWFLNQAGFQVDVFETENKAGGMISGAIPTFRLSDPNIAKDIERIKKSGVNIIEGQKIDKQKFESICKNYNYAYIATGAQVSRKLNLKGCDAVGVLDPLEFLRKAKRNGDVAIGKNVAVIGGGNTAMDAARTAFRLVGDSGSVTIIYRRTINEMPADRGEIKAVMDEGIEFIELVSPIKILEENGVVTGLECLDMEFKGTDSSGRPLPVEIPDSDHSYEFDTIIPAIGQELDIDFVDADLLKTRNGSYQTKIENVFIGGDALRGAATAIKAIGDGRKVAIEIMKKEKISPTEPPIKMLSNDEFAGLKIKKTRREAAVRQKILPADERRNFNLVISPLTKLQSNYEAARCLQCDVICNVCVSVCPNHAFFGFEINTEELDIPIVKYGDDFFNVKFKRKLDVRQKYQVINIADWCNECGNCTTFCPTAGVPYKDKMRLHFEKDSFKNETSGFLLAKDGKLVHLTMKKNGNLSILSENWDAMIFENDDCMAILNKKTFAIEHIDVFTEKGGSIELPEITEMKMIYQATKNLI
ncbi:MAG: putative selenate reductase subunit YgfK [Bacteroidales bacterium]|nr:putative selenate reductase subunit YgfK [Bacteroidales bacterium]